MSQWNDPLTLNVDCTIINQMGTNEFIAIWKISGNLMNTQY